MRLRPACVLAGALLSPVIAAQARARAPADGIIVTAPGDLPGADEAGELDARDLHRAQGRGLAGAISANLPGASLSEAQSNPYQPNLVYHGFTASPLQGNGQGLAVYVDGMRFNQPFGDTVNFDLLPEGAIESLSIRDASPVYGLNALGGALVVATRTGRTAPGVVADASAGDHGRRQASIEAGWASGGRSAFLTAQASHDGGWREHSPSTLYSAFGDLGWDGAASGIHFKLAAADTDLTGNGSAPVELLAARRDAVFTFPDNTRNRHWRASLHPWIALGAHTRIEASLAFQSLRQRTVNGDLADIAGCEDDPALLCLETADDAEQSPLRDAAGALLPDMLAGEDYGLLNRSRTRSRAWSALVQLADSRVLLGRDNALVAGVSHDRGITRFAASSQLGALTDERSVEGLGPVIALPDGAIAPVSLRASTEYWGLFLSDRLSLGGGFSVEAGLRWNHARIVLNDRLGTALNGRHRFRRLNPGIELGYRASAGLALRAGYSETSRAPTPAELSCADENAPCSLTNFFVGDPPLDQVVARSWLLGASGRFEGGWHGEWTLSAYRATNSDDIQFTASATRGRAFFRNIGRTRRQGIEARLKLTRGRWSILAGYAFTDATFRSPLALNSADNPSADDDGRIAVQPGDRLPSIPRHRGILSADYEGPGFALGADLQAQSGQYFAGDEGNDEKPAKGFAVVNLRGSLDLAERIALFGAVTNLFDRRHASFGTFSETGEIDLAEAPGASDPRSLSPGAPRRWRLGIRFAW